MNKGYVYLLCDLSKDRVYKVGVTKGSIEKRIAELQTGNSGEIMMIKYFETEHPYYMESFLHRKFASKRVLSEWFNLSDDDVNDFKSICENCEKIYNSLKDNPFFNKNHK